ncbi:hypothetical protein [Niallia taxi]|uniref:hypothetical protein n=1 Tax=Niallia taxi TaxID=2499688 RepID=UPI0015F6F755|nr:hypothetical protein [Niallia taxi]
MKRLALDFNKFQEAVEKKKELPSLQPVVSQGMHVVATHLFSGTRTREIDFNSFTLQDLEGVADELRSITPEDEYLYSGEDEITSYQKHNRGNFVYEYQRASTSAFALHNTPLKKVEYDDFV